MIPIKLGLPMKYAVSNIKQLPRQPLNTIISYLIWVNKMDVVSPKCSVMDYGQKCSIFYFVVQLHGKKGAVWTFSCE